MKKTALSFDDGPNGRHTLRVLDILKKYKVKACFFLLGKNVKYYPEIARRIKQEGHLIGNHTYSHKHLNRLKPEDILWQIEKAEDIFKERLGIRARFIRLPYGEYNQTAGRLIKNKGYQLIGWNPRIEDYKNSPKSIVDMVISQTKDGSIVTLHDGANIKHGVSRINTVRALPEIIETLRTRGFKFVRLDRLH